MSWHACTLHSMSNWLRCFLFPRQCLEMLKPPSFPPCKDKMVTTTVLPSVQRTNGVVLQQWPSAVQLVMYSSSGVSSSQSCLLPCCGSCPAWPYGSSPWADSSGKGKIFAKDRQVVPWCVSSGAVGCVPHTYLVSP